MQNEKEMRKAFWRQPTVSNMKFFAIFRVRFSVWGFVFPHANKVRLLDRSLRSGTYTHTHTVAAQ